MRRAQPRLGEQLHDAGLLAPPYDERSYSADEPVVEDDGRLLIVLLTPSVARAPGAPLDAPLAEPLRVIASWQRRWLDHAGSGGATARVLSARAALGGSAFFDCTGRSVVALDMNLAARSWRTPNGARSGAIGWMALRVVGEPGPERSARSPALRCTRARASSAPSASARRSP